MHAFRVFSSFILLLALTGQTPPAARPPIVFVQMPATPGLPPGEQGRLVLLTPSGALRPLAPGFHSAADPAVSWDATRILFAAKRTAAGPWQIYETGRDGRNLRQVVKTPWDCRSPIYQSRIFYLDDPEPQPQITFTGYESGAVPQLYSARLDGSGLRRLTYHPAGAATATLNEDGRLLYSARFEKSSLLYGINLDGTDVERFSGAPGRAFRSMPAYAPSRHIVFVENDQPEWDSSGSLATVDLRRHRHTYRALTLPSDGLYAWPSALSSGAILAARRLPNQTHGLYRIDPATGQATLLYDDPQRHDIQPRELAPRPVPPGRASVVEESASTGKIYCLSAFTTAEPMPKPARVRFVAYPGERVLGEAPLEADGSFHVEAPANTPLRVEALDAAGKLLRSSNWFWVKNKENRGCIGCHEDPELTPENRFATALGKPATPLTHNKSAP